MAISLDTAIGIVGAGAAGLGAAWFLRKQGFRNVTVLERSDRVGGKCNTFVFDGKAFDMGALEVAEDYFDIRDIANEVGAKLTAEPARRLIHPIATIWNMLENKPLELFEAIDKYKAALAKYDAFVTTPGFAGMPPELATPFMKWARDGGMISITPFLEVAIFAYGYGQLDTISAGYVLKYIDSNIFDLIMKGPLPKLPGTTRWPLVFVEGFGDFWKRVADRLALRGVNIGLSKEIKSIVRGPNVVATLVDGTRHTFDRLILASPLDTASLGFLDLQPEERAIFDRVRYNHYVTAACEIDGVPDGWNEEPPNVKTGHMLQVWKPWDDVDMAVFYAMRDGTMTADDVVKNFIADAPGQLHGGTITNVPYVKDWNYFPHFDEADLRAGIYDKLEALQGQRATYYAGGLMNFETVKTTAAYSRALAEKYFQ